MSKSLEALREALYGTGLVQPVDAKGRGGAVSCLCRQLPGQEAPWIAVVDQLLSVADGNSLFVDFHVCRRYVRREGKMVFGWFLGIEAKNAAGLVEAVGAIVTILKSAKPSLTSIVQAAPQSQQAPQAPQQFALKPLSQKEINEHTRAHRRPPEESGPDPVAPDRAPVPRLKTIARGQDEKGRPTSIVEMPLPHTYKELNIPKSVQGAPLRFAKGAVPTAGVGE